jgi:hypothetical protein
MTLSPTEKNKKAECFHHFLFRNAVCLKNSLLIFFYFLATFTAARLNIVPILIPWYPIVKHPY